MLKEVDLAAAYAAQHGGWGQAEEEVHAGAERTGMLAYADASVCCRILTYAYADVC
jgi:hypothetical protein